MPTTNKFQAGQTVYISDSVCADRGAAILNKNNPIATNVKRLFTYVIHECEYRVFRVCDSQLFNDVGNEYYVDNIDQHGIRVRERYMFETAEECVCEIIRQYRKCLFDTMEKMKLKDAYLLEVMNKYESVD